MLKDILPVLSGNIGNHGQAVFVFYLNDCAREGGFALISYRPPDEPKCLLPAERQGTKQKAGCKEEHRTGL